MKPLAMTPEQAWTAGLPLRTAYDRFASVKASQEEDSEVAHIRHLLETKKFRPEDFPRVIQMAGNQVSAYFQFQGRRWESLVAKLAAGKLIATGYVLPRRIADEPTWIPLDVWHSSKIDWDRSSLNGGGLEFESVRIVRARQSAAQRLMASIIRFEDFMPPRRRAGRPSRVTEIWNAYEHLKKAGAIDFSQPIKIAADKIRASIRESYPAHVQGEKGLRYEAIRRVISPDFLKHK
jgi:hypothetical protein